MNIIGSRINTTTERFGKIIREDCVFVDKSFFIQEFIEDANDALLITRPRRFGKSLNLSMLQHFFAPHVRGELTQGLFDHLEIAKVNEGRLLQQHQGQYPVILISFKSINALNYEGAIDQIRQLFGFLYEEHSYLLESPKLSDYEKENFKKFRDSIPSLLSPERLQVSIYYLTQFLFKAYEKRVVVLIDEYDTPVNLGYQYDYLDEISNFMRGLLGQALKGNDFLHKGLMTGILRVSKSDMLSGLNNLEVHTIFSKKYGSYFGFMEEEVVNLLQIIEMPFQLEAVRNFYNGYKIGDYYLYNPWALMNYCSEQNLLAYWTLTSNDAILKNILINSDKNIKEGLEKLIKGELHQGSVNLNLRYEDLMEKESALWTLLVFCGYLTMSDHTLSELGDEYTCDLKIPNREILGFYRSIFVHHLKEQFGTAQYDTFLKQLVEGDRILLKNQA